MIRTGATYAVVSLGLTEWISIAANDQIAECAAILAAFGFPVALAFSWFFEVRLDSGEGDEALGKVDVSYGPRVLGLAAVCVVMAAGAVWVVWGRLNAGG